MATPAVAMDPRPDRAAGRGGRRARRCRTCGCRAAPATTRSRCAELTGVAMLFVRCAGGVSHHPDESVDAADVAVALDVLDGFLRRLAEPVAS